MKVLLFCGGGMSSGFVAQAMRKYARKMKIDMEVLARGEGEVLSMMNGVDAVLVSPHFSHMMNDPAICEAAKKNNVLLMQIDSKDYAMLDGEAVCKKLLEKMEK